MIWSHINTIIWPKSLHTHSTIFIDNVEICKNQNNQQKKNNTTYNYCVHNDSVLKQRIPYVKTLTFHHNDIISKTKQHKKKYKANVYFVFQCDMWCALPFERTMNCVMRFDWFSCLCIVLNGDWEASSQIDGMNRTNIKKKSKNTNQS